MYGECTKGEVGEVDRARVVVLQMVDWNRGDFVSQYFYEGEGATTHTFMSLSCMLAGFSAFLPSISANLSRTLSAARKDASRIWWMRLLLLVRSRLRPDDGERSRAAVTWIVGISCVLVVVVMVMVFVFEFGFVFGLLAAVVF